MWEGPIYFLGAISLCSTCSGTESFEQRRTGLDSFFSKLVQGEAAADLAVLCTSAELAAAPPLAPSHPPKRKEKIALLPSLVSVFYAPVLMMYLYLKKGQAWSEGVATLQLLLSVSRNLDLHRKLFKDESICSLQPLVWNTHLHKIIYTKYTLSYTGSSLPRKI